MQEALDQFVDWHNNKLVRKQAQKSNISGHVPSQAFQFPEQYGGSQVHTLIPQEAIDAIRAQLPERETWVPADIDAVLSGIWQAQGSVSVTLASAWAQYRSIFAVWQGRGFAV
jgi:hypothetical protein